MRSHDLETYIGYAQDYAGRARGSAQAHTKLAEAWERLALGVATRTDVIALMKSCPEGYKERRSLTIEALAKHFDDVHAETSDT